MCRSCYSICYWPLMCLRRRESGNSICCSALMWRSCRERERERCIPEGFVGEKPRTATLSTTWNRSAVGSKMSLDGAVSGRVHRRLWPRTPPPLFPCVRFGDNTRLGFGERWDSRLGRILPTKPQSWSNGPTPRNGRTKHLHFNPPFFCDQPAVDNLSIFLFFDKFIPFLYLTSKCARALRRERKIAYIPFFVVPRTWLRHQ